jgi:uncharacterized protein YegP (UPF0339 family)
MLQQLRPVHVGRDQHPNAEAAMRRFVVCLCLLTLFASFAVMPHNVAVAQKDSGKGPYIEVAEGKDGKYRFTVRSADGKMLALSGAHADEKGALKAIEDLKTALKTAKIMPTKKTPKK